MSKLPNIIGSFFGIILVVIVAAIAAKVFCFGFNWSFSQYHLEFKQPFFVILALASLRLPEAIIRAWRY